MKKLLALMFCATACGAFAFPSYDTFNDTPGANLAGQTNFFGDKWYSIGTTSTGSPVVIATNSLSAPAGLPSATGNAVFLQNQAGLGGRLNIPYFAATNAATIFYSVLVQVNDITSLLAAVPSANSGGAFNMGLNNTAGTDAGQGTQPTAYGAALLIGSYNGGYIFGTSRAVGGGTGNRFWETNAPRTLGTTNFIVAEYEIVPGTANDICRLWINPDPSTFGTTTPPAPDVIVGDATHTPSADGDQTAINSFLLANRNTGTPNNMIVDELRLGTNWSQVTSTYVPAAPQPTLSISLLDRNTVQLSWRGDASGYTLQGASSLLSSGTPWTTVAGTPTTSGTNLIQTDTVSGMKFYRLISTQ